MRLIPFPHAVPVRRGVTPIGWSARCRARTHDRRRSGIPGAMDTITGEAPLALVTGASTGIGRELAREFAEHGFDVVVAADEPAIDDVANELARTGRHVTPVQTDLSTAAGVEALWSAVDGTGRSPAAVALNA